MLIILLSSSCVLFKEGRGGGEDITISEEWYDGPMFDAHSHLTTHLDNDELVEYLEEQSLLESDGTIKEGWK